MYVTNVTHCQNSKHDKYQLLTN